jgi:hypothetical protein
LKYHPEFVRGLTPIPMKLGGGHCMPGWLSAVGNRILECKSISQLYCEPDRASSLERGL